MKVSDPRVDLQRRHPLQRHPVQMGEDRGQQSARSGHQFDFLRRLGHADAPVVVGAATPAAFSSRATSS